MSNVTIRIPQLGEGLREAYLVDFLKSPGDAIARDEPLFTMETDKAITDVESTHAGTLVKWLVETDSVLEIGAEIAEICTADVSSSANDQPAPEKDSNRAESHSESPLVANPDQSEMIRQTDADTAWQSEGDSDLLTAIDRPAVRMAPRTRRYLRTKNLMSKASQIEVAGTKMSIADVERWQARNAVAASAGDVTHGVAEEPEPQSLFELVELPKSQLRLNYRLAQAASTCVPVTLVSSWVWERIFAAREITRPQQGPSAFAMVCWCVARAAKAHPRFRCALTSDGRSWKQFHSVNLGIAVSLPGDELVTAVIPDADTLTFEQFMNAWDRNITLARNGVDQADESTTLMVSNIGNIGMDIGVPAIVAPAVATLAIGQPVDTPVRDGDSFRFERKITATMSFDHRIANGIGAAGFLNDIRDQVETFALPQ